MGDSMGLKLLPFYLLAQCFTSSSAITIMYFMLHCGVIKVYYFL